jgi:hypothetical protein
MAKQKTPENSINPDHIKKVHLMLSDLKAGEEILNFLKTTEPLFMEEVNRFIVHEIGKLKYHIPHDQATYVGSVIGAVYIAGFLIAREAEHDMFDGLINIKSIKEILSMDEIDKLIDKGRDEGKTYKEIAMLLRNKIDPNIKTIKPKDPPKEKHKGKKLDLGDLS